MGKPVPRSSQVSITKMAATIRNGLHYLKVLRAIPYDGIAGMLPDWVPEFHTARFLRIQEDLLWRHKHATLVEWINNVNKPGKSVGPPWNEADIRYLRELRDCIKTGEQDGLLQLGGGNARRGYLSRKGSIKGGQAKASLFAGEREAWTKFARDLQIGHPSWSIRTLAKNVKGKTSTSASVETIRKHLAKILGRSGQIPKHC